MIYLIVCDTFWRGHSIFMNITKWKFSALYYKILFLDF